MSENFEIEYKGQPCQGPFRVRPILEADGWADSARAELLDAHNRVLEVFRPTLEDEIGEAGFQAVRARAELRADQLNARLQELQYRPVAQPPVVRSTRPISSRPEKNGFPLRSLSVILACAGLVYGFVLPLAPGADASTADIRAKIPARPVVLGLDAHIQTTGHVSLEEAEAPFRIYPSGTVALRIGETLRSQLTDARGRIVQDTWLTMRSMDLAVLSPSEETGLQTAHVPGRATVLVQVPDLHYETTALIEVVE